MKIYKGKIYKLKNGTVMIAKSGIGGRWQGDLVEGEQQNIFAAKDVLHECDLLGKIIIVAGKEYFATNTTRYRAIEPIDSNSWFMDFDGTTEPVNLADLVAVAPDEPDVSRGEARCVSCGDIVGFEDLAREEFCLACWFKDLNQ